MRKFLNISGFVILILLSIASELFVIPPGNSEPIICIKQHKLKNIVRIFNGHDISNLKLVLRNKNVMENKIYSIKDKAIYFVGGYVGYLRTKERYSNFNLHAEWKWPEKSEKGNSGILVFIQPPDTVWPNCIQINFKENHAGDLIAMNGAKFKEAEGKYKNTEVIFSKPSEKPIGEWNLCDIQCIGDSMSVYINGVLQNKATKISLSKGMIGWQLEGKPVALRNIYLTNN